MTAPVLWDQFVAAAGADAAVLVEAAGDAARLRALAQRAFRIGLSSLLLGADDVGRLAIAIERAIDRMLDAGAGGVPAELADAIASLRAALVQLANADRSGARIEGLALDEVRRALEAGDPAASEPAQPVIAAREAVSALPAPEPASPVPPADRAAPAAIAGFAWQPVVDDDMIELFFDEATERVAALAGKLIAIEQRPGDGELVRDVFRDLHTVKGSSAMVGLQPVNQLAHAAEDLIGQVRDAGRAPDAPLIDAVLAALDGLR